ncbi:MAG: hypothetical protein KVP17_001730 [Porospora cf. gigantea B]|uniref:uncharacterized protein n=1 Tax=Porospora cf. gigantea B TaxID=2853592 RepID=UPI003571F83D|nr:MAG: hypothetical protein KVP17_001730 [Porospora cf. gigantea B]
MDYSQASRVLDITCYDRETVLLLDEIVRAMYHGGTEQIDMHCAHQVLAELKGLPNAWSIAGAVMTHAQSYEARHFAVSLVEDVVQTRWHALQADERETLKTFVMNLVSHCQNPTTMQTQLFFVNKVNETLVKIAAREWPERWPSFVTDLTSTARQNQSTCENTLTIFRILAEDLFDYGSEMTSKKNQTLVQRFAEEFGPVLELCLFVLTQYKADQAGVSASLLQATMSCLANFLRWMPETAVFHTGLIDLLVYAKDQQVVRIQVLKCFTEIVSIKPTEATTGVVMPLWDQILSMADRLPESTFQYNKEVNSQASQFWEQYYRQMAILFTSFLRLYRGLMERRPDAEGARRLQLTHEFLLRMSRVPNDETFKICLNYWHDLAEDVVLEVVRNADLKGISSSEVFRGDRGVVTSFSSRASEFSRTFERLREILVSRMAKPKEVCICYDEDSGTVDKEHLPDTDEISLYEVMRESIVYLTNLNPEHMSDVLNQLLRHIIDGLQQGGHQKEWNPTILNRVCWSVGSISGSLPPAVERSFLIEVTRSLMWLCGHKKGKENKAIVAAMVLYVFGCYTDFLSQSASLLETLVTKCFEFMADPFPGVQEMAVNCFLNICTGAGKALTKIQPDGLRTVKPGKSILEWVVSSVPELEALLVGQKQVLILYEAVATAIGNYGGHTCMGSSRGR